MPTRYLRALLLPAILLVACNAQGSIGGKLPFPTSGVPGKPMTLSWKAPSAKQDGKPIALSSLGGFRIYLGQQPNKMHPVVDVDAHHVTRYTLRGLPSGNYFVGLTAYDRDGRESRLSNVQKVVVAKGPVGKAYSSNMGNHGSVAAAKARIQALTNELNAATNTLQSQQAALGRVRNQLKKAKANWERHKWQNEVNRLQVAVNATIKKINQAKATRASLYKLVSLSNTRDKALAAVRNAKATLAKAKNQGKRTQATQQLQAWLSKVEEQFAAVSRAT